RSVRAEALASGGEYPVAIDVARAAVDLAAATDVLLLHADARRALAAALRAAGHEDEAAAEEARAIELCESKGATLLAERARRGAGRGVQAGRAPDDRGAPARPLRGRVCANPATAFAARLDALIAARDTDVLPTLLAEGSEVIDHTTGVTYDRQGALFTWRA